MNKKYRTASMIDLNPAIPIIILNVNYLNTPFKGRDCQIRWKCKTKPCFWIETHFEYEDIGRLKVKRIWKIYPTNSIQRKTGSIILISKKVNIEANNFIRDDGN